jgi:hypothetical protein
MVYFYYIHLYVYLINLQSSFQQLLNKDGSIPSGVQFTDVMDELRAALWKQKELERISYLEKGRVKAAMKKEKNAVPAVSGSMVYIHMNTYLYVCMCI